MRPCVVWLCLSLCWLTSCANANCEYEPSHPPLHFSTSPNCSPANATLLDKRPQYSIHWWLINNESVLFVVEANVSTWFAIGLNAKSQCDLIVAWSDDSDQLVVQDYLLKNNVIIERNTFLNVKGSFHRGGIHIEFTKNTRVDDHNNTLVQIGEKFATFAEIGVSYDFGEGPFKAAGPPLAFLSAKLSQSEEVAEEELRDVYLRTMQKAHGIAMVVGWISCIYFALILARYLRGSFKKQWFRVYLLLQCFGLFVLFVGILFATLFDDTFPDSLFFQSHHLFGFILIVFLILQIMLGVLADRKLTIMQNNAHHQTPVYPNKAHGYIGWVMMVMVVITNMLGAREMGVSAATWTLLSIVHGIPFAYQAVLWIYTKTTRGVSFWGPGYVTMHTLSKRSEVSQPEHFEISEDIAEDLQEDITSESLRTPHDVLQMRIFLAVWVVTFSMVVALGIIM